MMTSNIDCPCCSGKRFSDCCGQYLENNKQPKTPVQLMRSRFTAYALGNYGEYLLDTWFPVTAQGLTIEELSLKLIDWTKLDIVSKSQDGDEGTVEFNAYFVNQNNEIELMNEHSEFKRISGKWFYVGKQV